MSSDSQMYLVDALKAMCDEFRALDLPYGSAAYNQCISALNKFESERNTNSAILGVIEGQQVYLGDTLYYKDDGIKVEVVGLIDARLSVKSKQYGVCGEYVTMLTRVKP